MPAVGSPGDDGDCEDCHGDSDKKKEKVEWKTIEKGSENFSLRKH